MTPRQIELVQESWSRVEPVADRATRLFYRRLFESTPELREHFTTCVAEQGSRLADALQVAVEKLDAPETLAEELGSLRQTHAENGIGTQHHDRAAEALSWMLDQELGEAFDPDTRTAWDEAYSSLAGSMLGEAAAHEPMAV